MPKLLTSLDYGGEEPNIDDGGVFGPKVIRPGAGPQLLTSTEFGGTEPDLQQPTQQQIPQPQLAQQPVQPEPEEEPGFWNSFTDAFTGSLRETKETEALPELATARGITSGEFGKDLKTAASLMFVADDEAKKDIIKENFPGVKMQEDEHGTTIMEFPDGKKAVLNKPGLSFQDFMGTLGTVAAFFGPTKLARIGTTLPQRAAIGGAGAAVVDYGLQKGAQAIGSEQEVDPGSVLLSGTMGAAGELVGPALKGFKESRKAKKLGVAKEEFKEAAALTKEADVIAEKTGIPLFQAQKTLDPASLEKQSFVGTLSGGSKKAAKELKAQNKAAFDAVQSAFDKIAPAQSLETAQGRLKTVAQASIDARKAIRAEKASPLYTAAKESKGAVPLTETLKAIKEVKSSYPTGGSMAKVMSRVENLIGKQKIGKIQKPTIKKLHGAKLEIDDMLSKFGEGGLGNTEKRELVTIKNILLDEMDAANPAYREARQVFSANTPAVKELEDSIIGKISRLDETQLKSISGKLFDPAETNPQVIAKAKKVIEEIDPQAWRDITRTELEKRIGSVRVDLLKTGETIENVPGQLHRAIFGNSKQRKILYSGLDTETAKNVRFLEEGLKRASLGRLGGSQTATREEIKKELKGGISNTIRNVFKAPLDTLASTGESAMFDKKVRALADVLYNPKWKPKLKELRKVDPNSKRAQSMFSRILSSSERDLKTVSKTLPQTQNRQGE